VALDEGGRIPGAGRQGADPVEVDDAAWALAQGLAG